MFSVNSPILFILVGAIIAVVLAQSFYFLIKAVKRAKELLTKTNASIFEIANSVGYDDQFYFSRLLKKHVNVSPLEYRKQNKSKA